MKHEILYDTCNEYMVAKTTHELVEYDTLTEEFIVSLGDDSWCRVGGRNRFKMAIKIADNFRPTKGTLVYIVDPMARVGYVAKRWMGSPCEMVALERGLVFLEESQAKNTAKAFGWYIS